MQPLNLDDLDGADDLQPNPAAAPGRAGTHAYGQPDPTGAAAWCYEHHTTRHGPPPAPGDGHNHWVTGFTKFCNESGAPVDDVLALALDTAPAGHDARKIEATVRGIYRRDASQHGSKPYTAPTAGGNKPNFSADFDQKEPPAPPPTFGADVYNALPDYLRRCCEPFDGHEKAVMLVGSLAVLSGCFPGAGGTYGNKHNGLNLFSFVLAPAASGKGTLSWARRLARPWHRRLLDESRRAAADYDTELAAHKAAGKGSAPGPPPAAPPRRLLYLPGDSTAAALIGALAENEGRGIICENEADTLTTALGGEHGKFADKLCKIFEHEPVTLTRKTDRLHIELDRPAVSIALTGTPAQLPRLMPNAENGLVSRFLFYTFSQPYVWRSGRPTGAGSLESYFDGLGAELSRMIELTPTPGENGELGAEITLSSPDFDRLDAAGAAGLADAVAAAGGAGASQAFRLGLIAWRVAGLLTVLRCFENGELPAGRLTADPADVATALAIMEVARAHALAVLASLPTPAGAASGKFAAKADLVAKVQELHAQGLSYREIADQTGVPFSTVRNWLKNF